MDHRPYLYRDFGGYPADVIAMQSHYASIAIDTSQKLSMASLTIRKLDDAIRDELRLRAARNGRSVEDEVRVILRDASQNRTSLAATASQAVTQAPAAPTARSAATGLSRVTLIIGGGIAAYKALDLIRRLKERHIQVRCVLTKAAQQFVTPLAASALSNERCYTDLFDPESEFDAGHIRLARECDLIVVAPATADLMAKIAQGHADDLASAILLAANRPILLAPAMNPLMWNNAATRRNVALLERDGVALIGPNAGEMAEAGEAGIGRMAEPLEIAAAAERFLRPPQPRPLAGKRVLITAGPTHEPIDPVRYIANRSSGKQGYAIAAAAQAAGADVTLVSGPVDLGEPAGVTVRHVESARDMLHRVEAALPADIAIFAAAVADWRVANAGEQKLKKTSTGMPPLQLVENPDILATISKLQDKRPPLVIGFAAETENLIENAKAKLARKGCDWIVANDVSPATGVMGGDRNTVHLLMRDGEMESWPVMTKEQVATELVARIAKAVEKSS
jgi:phosphopantothenoylcysteine decarboxylase / phosphopantothenate---cysteine ligase